MPVELPLRSGISDYQFTSELDGTEYLFNVRWNSRNLTWYLDILQEDETPIRHGVPIVLGTPLAYGETDPAFPNGVLIAFDTSGSGLDAGFSDLGERIVLLFYTDAEVEAIT